MLTKFSTRLALAAALTVVSSGAMATSYTITNGGLTGIFSTTFAGPPGACTGGSPSYCAFFGGLPSAGQLAAISVSQNPTGITTAVPGGITPIPLAGSFLDMTLSGGNTLLTLNGGSITLADSVITVVPAATTATVSGAGMVFDSTLMPTVADSGGGVFEFLVASATPLAVDFSKFSAVTTSCVGSPGVCGAILGDVLFLDSVKYRLLVDFDADFSSFTASFIGQTSNASMTFVTLNSVPVPGAVWLMGSALAALGWIRRKAITA